MDLTEARNKIDAIDDQIAALYSERMDLCREIGKEKARLGKNTDVPEREKEIVNREQLYDLLDELRLCAPEEIKRYQKIITNRDGILNEAQQRAEDMLSQAQQQTAQILDQNEIVQTAYQRAEDIMRQATEEAERLVNAAQDESDQMRKAALLYTNDLLSEAQGHVEESLKEIDNKSRMLTSALKNSIQLMRSNKEELMMQLEPTKAAAASEPQMPEEPEQLEPQPQGQESFEVPEDAFLKNAEE